MFQKLLAHFSAEKTKVDKKAALGFDSLPNIMITMGIIGVVGIVFIILFNKLGENDAITDDADAESIINASKDIMTSPFDILGVAIVIIVLVIILGVLFMLYTRKE